MAEELLSVTVTFDGDCLLCFKEEDIKRACKKAGCNDDVINNCVEEMKCSNDFECTSCFVCLIQDLGISPEYIKKDEYREGI